MSWEMIGSISALIASVATLLTLVYLAIQVRESNVLARATSLQSVLSGWTERFNVLNIEHPELQESCNRAHGCWDDASPREKRLFGNQMTINLLQMQNIMQFHEHGLIKDVDYETWLRFLASHVMTPGGKRWWVDTKNVFTPTVVAAIDEYLAENPSTPSMIELFPELMEV
jgi:hypothetical protein